MDKFLRILKPVKVYAKHESKSRIIKELVADELILFNREKRRNQQNWMEIYLEKDKVGYLKKDSDAFFRCSFASLNDEISSGFNYEYKTEDASKIATLFHQVGTLNKEQHTVETIEVKTIDDSDEKKIAQLQLEYNADIINVIPVVFTKESEFYVTNDAETNDSLFIQVDNRLGKKGYLLKTTNYTNTEDKWVTPFAITVAILAVIGIFIAFLASGWIVISGLMFIVGFGVAFVAIIVMQILILILRGIFNHIRKRL
ncbi:hypothetical protein [Cellulophaga sp. L1A9]|uniref:hypothetical protein n=1 Tax=Cellulophaga sp. L1A9 TaxID=2686362 RepID=UPI00131D10E6|nr:hypothetical protein [Cellulophaga sp. L1A9]